MRVLRGAPTDDELAALIAVLAAAAGTVSAPPASRAGATAPRSPGGGRPAAAHPEWPVQTA
ncbi:hypothetical protein Ae406Ps2_1215c [Pseudonocardia sp. Ae406_Ps2]|nr:hypothetical protein Ae406Ps2_1215c [Pseudonocardia sp. Ae406_Ps2]OLM06991.1 hypothetical protein Ae331Ps2_4701 [Pseudonocardia sp. Ae331_Ps2]OLM22790.1 hypothetical protein Ae706Ps2_1222c [Pseudonocardia sp. Ae706_Ps2]